MAIRENLQTVVEQIAGARHEPFAEHPLARLITRDWQQSVGAVVSDNSYLVTGSPGKGNWAETVWLAVFDRMVTESAQHGFYLVYLIPQVGQKAFLSLNQGTEEIYSRVGGRRYRQVLEDTATRDADLLDDEETHGLVSGPIDLQGTGRLTRGYESGNIFAVEYGANLPSDAVLEDDLDRLLLLYQSLVEARDQVQTDETNLVPTTEFNTELEASRYRWHKRAERSRKLARKAKRFHGTRCQVPACGKDLSEIYGSLAEGYIEAHHLTPFASLEGRPMELDPKTDFAVVCPDCHRMLHRRTEPYSLEELSAQMLLP